MTTNNAHYAPGLEGVVAAQTRLSSVDGQRGELIINGFPIENLAARATYEEVTYLLWHDTLPTATQLATFSQSLAQWRFLPPATIALLRAAAAQNVPPMDALRMAAGTLSLDNPPPAEAAMALVSRMPIVVATYLCLLNGQEPLTPRPDLSHTANYLYLLFGTDPLPAQVRGLETYLNTVIDHGLNASTFTARVIISTDSDLFSAIVGAIGALKGPRHGGAPGPALDMVFDIGQPDRVESYLRAKLDRGERLMGFGHRVYKVRDPRAILLAQAAGPVYSAGGDIALYQLAQQVEETAITLLEEYKPGRKLQTNVEFYTALLLHGLGLDTPLFTPTFAVARTAGWIAHCFEQQATNRIIRPESRYQGDTNRQWVELAARNGHISQ